MCLWFDTGSERLQHLLLSNNILLKYIIVNFQLICFYQIYLIALYAKYIVHTLYFIYQSIFSVAFVKDKKLSSSLLYLSIRLIHKKTKISFHCIELLIKFAMFVNNEEIFLILWIVALLFEFNYWSIVRFEHLIWAADTILINGCFLFCYSWYDW